MRVDAEHARHLNRALTDRFGHVLVLARSGRTACPPARGLLMRQIGDRDHLAGAAEPGDCRAPRAAFSRSITTCGLQRVEFGRGLADQREVAKRLRDRRYRRRSRRTSRRRPSGRPSASSESAWASMRERAIAARFASASSVERRGVGRRRCSRRQRVERGVQLLALAPAASLVRGAASRGSRRARRAQRRRATTIQRP